MEMKDFSKDVKLATFKGKRDDWRMWSTKFLAFAAFREFDEILSGEKNYLTRVAQTLTRSDVLRS